VEGMTVDEEQMKANLELTHGALFSQRVLLALVKGGDGGDGRGAMTRDDAYRIVQSTAQRAWDTGTPMRELLASEPAAAGLDMDAIFDYAPYVRYAQEIVARLDEIV
jgi:adenylosuccinate lyase